jgi:hypothetical protein
VYRQVLDRKTVLGRLGVENGDEFPAKVVIQINMGDFQALELLHATGPLTNELDCGYTLTPIVDRGDEDIRKYPSIRGVRATQARREQGDMVVRGPLRQRIDERRAEQEKRRRPRSPLAFQALVALHTAGVIVNGFALFPDQLHAVEAAIAFVEER